jgi:RNA polymerase sigma factor (sigma-70 family)
MTRAPEIFESSLTDQTTLEPRVAILQDPLSLPAEKEAAFTEIVVEYYNVVLGYAHKILGSREAAEDVAQFTFMKAWEKIGDFASQSPASLKSWLFSIAHNKSFDTLRSSRSVPVSFAVETQYPQDLSESSLAVLNPDSTQDVVEINETIRQLMAGIPPEQLRPLIMFALGFKYKDIAEILRLEKGTLASQMSRTSKKSRAVLSTIMDSQEPKAA